MIITKKVITSKRKICANSLYFKDEAWMKYHKCPECGEYVINPPAEIKYARADNRNLRRLCWNSALRILSRKTGWRPCYKCTAKYAKVLYYGGDFNSPVYTDCCGIPIRRCITATRTGLGGDIYEDNQTRKAVG